MKVELGKIGSISHGVVLNRVKAKHLEQAKRYPLLTISRLLQEEEGEKPQQEMDFPVEETKISSLKLAKEGMIVIGLTSFHKAVVLTKEHEGMIISSNFLILEFPGGIMDPHYFAWYFNEHPKMRELQKTVMNGEGKVKVLSIRLIRELMIQVPDLVTQMAVGNLYALQNQKESLWKEKLRLEKEILSLRMTALTSVENEKNDFISGFFDQNMLERQSLIERQLTEIEKKKNMYAEEMKLLRCME